MPETTPLIKAALNLRGGAGFDVYIISAYGLKELITANIIGVSMTRHTITKTIVAANLPTLNFEHSESIMLLPPSSS